MTKPYLKPAVNKAVWVIGVIAAIGGGAYSLDDRWARRIWAEQKFTQIDQANWRTRYSQVLADIAMLTSKRRTVDEERWLQSLLIERQQLCVQLRLPQC